MFYVSIPLNSGHQFELMPTDTGISLKGLNPFEFRASVRTESMTKWQDISRLNPFEFRASVRTNRKELSMFEVVVSIPLNSGHQFEPISPADPKDINGSQSL